MNINQMYTKLLYCQVPRCTNICGEHNTSQPTMKDIMKTAKRKLYLRNSTENYIGSVIIF
jgi:hypothetical protein